MCGLRPLFKSFAKQIHSFCILHSAFCITGVSPLNRNLQLSIVHCQLSAEDGGPFAGVQLHLDLGSVSLAGNQLAILPGGDLLTLGGHFQCGYAGGRGAHPVYQCAACEGCATAVCRHRFSPDQRRIQRNRAPGIQRQDL